MFEHANRVHPIYFEYPHEKIDDITIELPAGWQVSSLPAAKDQDAHVVRYVLKVNEASGSVELKRQLTLDLLMVEAKHYAALRQFFELIRTGDGEQIVLQPGAIHAGN